MKRFFLILAGIAALLWLAGLQAFVAHIETLAEPAIGSALESTDAIVVLTGGSERVSTGLALLRAGKGKKLFISGVHAGLTLDEILGNQAAPKPLRDCCIVLGHAAGSTLGNAEETREWLRHQNAHSLRLVTANYHMPRSLLIFHAAMPEMTIIAHPVAPDSVKLEGWWAHPGTASLLVTEYTKYLWANARQWVGD